jgi:membrane protein YdbS with pleckstrin-like domain
VAYPRDLLNQGETLVLDLRPHWLFLVPSGGALFAALIGSLLIFVGWQPTGSMYDILRIVCALVVLGTAGWFALTYLKWTTTNFVLTSDRLISRVGIFAKEGLEIPLERINTVFSSQSVFERIVGAGDLWVTEYVLTYDGRPSYTVSIMEFAGGKVVRETQYFSDPFEPGPSRAQWAERIS